MRLIDAEKLEEWIQEFHPADAYWAISMLKNAPTIDAELVVHAHYYKNSALTLFPICSNCHMINAANHNYCENCGAKMDEEQE